MKNFTTLAIALLAAATFAVGQRVNGPTVVSDRFIISAKAGGVNLVEGQVEILRAAGARHVLLKGDNVEVGDEVLSGPNGRAEILLNPGSYARIGANSSFSFKTTSLDDLQLVVDRGSVILEVYASNDFSVLVETPETTFRLADSGVYRINANEDESNIAVLRGRAEVVGAGSGRIKKGRDATIAGGQVEITKFEKAERDDLDEWSRERAKLLARANSSLERRELQGPLLSSFGFDAWSMYSSFGLWVYNPLFGGHCFLPFGYGWSSPYGFGFGRDIWGMRLPNCVYFGTCGGGVRYNGGVSRSAPTGTTGSNSNTSARTETRRPAAPPFQQMQQQEGRAPMQSGPVFGPVYRPSSPTVVAPPTERRAPAAPPLAGGSTKGRDN